MAAPKPASLTLKERGPYKCDSRALSSIEQVCRAANRRQYAEGNGIVYFIRCFPPALEIVQHVRAKTDVTRRQSRIIGSGEERNPDYVGSAQVCAYW
ncbi:hypothetical protein MRX96_005523 [Rhipicephalus microplus]